MSSFRFRRTIGASRRRSTSCFTPSEALETRALLSGIDLSYGTNGFASVTGAEPLTAQSIAHQSDGRAIVAAQTDLADTAHVYRLEADGSLDTSFGTNGFTVVPGGSFDTVNIDDLDRIVVSGQSEVARLDINGQLDASFGTSGTQGIHPSNFGVANAVDPVGNVFVASQSSTQNSLAVTHLDADGNFIGIPVSINNSIFVGIEALPDGDFLLAHTQFDGTAQDLAITRYNPDGTPDTSFGTGGTTVVDANAPAGVWTIGQFAAFNGGFSDTIDINEDTGHIAIACADEVVVLQSNGTLDLSYDGDGVIDLPAGYEALSPQFIAGDKLIVGSVESNSTPALIQFNADGSLDTAFPDDGSSTLPGVLSLSSSQAMPFDIAYLPTGEVNVPLYNRLTLGDPVVAQVLTDGEVDDAIDVDDIQDELVDFVNDGEVNYFLGRSLNRLLRKAERAIENGRINRAIRRLRVFVRIVEWADASWWPLISSNASDTLVGMANQVITDLSGSS